MPRVPQTGCSAGAENMISTRENNDTVKQFVLSQEDARGGVA